MSWEHRQSFLRWFSNVHWDTKRRQWARGPKVLRRDGPPVDAAQPSGLYVAAIAVAPAQASSPTWYSYTVTPLGAPTTANLSDIKVADSLFDSEVLTKPFAVGDTVLIWADYSVLPVVNKAILTPEKVYNFECGT